MNEDQQKLVKVMNGRLKESIKFWYEATRSYLDINDFLPYLNVLIQSLRNLTFILQSHKKFIPNFEEWYEGKDGEREKMKQDKILKWLQDARTEVVHQKDLELRSLAKISLLNWKKFPLWEWEINPLIETKNIKIPFPTKLKNVLHQELRQPVLKLERKWIVKTLPNIEVLEALAYCYKKLKTIIINAYIQTGINIVETDVGNLEKDKHLILGYVPEDNRVAYLDLSDGGIFNFKKQPFSITEEIAMRAKIRYGKNIKIKKIKNQGSNDPFDELEFFLESAKNILKIDGNHVPMISIFYENGKRELWNIPTNNKTEQYLVIREVAKEIRKEQVKGLIFILEAWMSHEKNLKENTYACDDPKRKEALILTAIREDGKYVCYTTPFFHLGDSIVLEKTCTDSSLEEAYWLYPIFEAWGIKT